MALSLVLSYVVNDNQILTAKSCHKTKNKEEAT